MNQKIKKYLNDNIALTFTDFFYAYCAAKGIDDPESDLTEEEYDILEHECEEKITVNMLLSLCYAIEEDINERITYLMREK